MWLPNTHLFIQLPLMEFFVVVVNLPVLTFPSSLNGVVSLRWSFLDWVYILPFSPISIIFCKSPSPVVTLLNRECCIEMCNFNQVQYKTLLYRDLTQDFKQTEKALYLWATPYFWATSIIRVPKYMRNLYLKIYNHFTNIYLLKETTCWSQPLSPEIIIQKLH